MAQAPEKHTPIRQSVHVDCPLEDAFRLFTEKFGEWWPLTSYSSSGDDAESCAIEPWEGGRVLERTRSGEEREWGTVIDWDPPRRVEFTWHGGREQTVEVEFSVVADGTRVTLTHRGWHLAGVENCFAGFVAKQMMMAV
ncbi:MAG TPA: SRPBCC domain-containing protein [Bryobacteraceae bacterium]|nr:SRPBCC domain-containing protein [Bryobacteraceae bacterium]